MRAVAVLVQGAAFAWQVQDCVLPLGRFGLLGAVPRGVLRSFFLVLRLVALLVRVVACRKGRGKESKKEKARQKEKDRQKQQEKERNGKGI